MVEAKNKIKAGNTQSGIIDVTMILSEALKIIGKKDNMITCKRCGNQTPKNIMECIKCGFINIIPKGEQEFDSKNLLNSFSMK